MFDCQVYLPAQTEIKDVALILGRSLGYEYDDGKYPRCSAVRIKPVDWHAGYALLYFDKHPDFNPSYFFESPDGRRHLLTKCVAYKIALSVRLVRFLGGSVDFNDSDNTSVDFKRPAPFKQHPTNDPEWTAWYQKLHAIQPLTRKEVEKYEKFESYSDPDFVLANGDRL